VHFSDFKGLADQDRGYDQSIPKGIDYIAQEEQAMEPLPVAVLPSLGASLGGKPTTCSLLSPTVSGALAETSGGQGLASSFVSKTVSGGSSGMTPTHGGGVSITAVSESLRGTMRARDSPQDTPARETTVQKFRRLESSPRPYRQASSRGRLGSPLASLGDSPRLLTSSERVSFNCPPSAALGSSFAAQGITSGSGKQSPTTSPYGRQATEVKSWKI